LKSLLEGLPHFAGKDWGVFGLSGDPIEEKREIVAISLFPGVWRREDPEKLFCSIIEIPPTFSPDFDDLVVPHFAFERPKAMAPGFCPH